LLALAGLVVVGSAFWFWSGDTNRQAPLSVVEEVLDAAQVKPDETPGKRDQRLQQILDSHFEDPVTLRHADMPRAGAGRRGLLIWGRLLQSYKPARLTAEQVQLGLSDDGEAATVRLVVALSGEKNGESVDAERVVELRLRKRDGTWKIQSVEVQAGANDVPEARP
jgi:ketosteroid isomerase-like protein